MGKKRPKGPSSLLLKSFFFQNLEVIRLTMMIKLLSSIFRRKNKQLSCFLVSTF